MIIEAKKLTKDYLSTTNSGLFRRKHVITRALNDLDIRIEQGSITGLVGPNGAGKTTFIKLCLGLISATSGKLSVMGHDPYKKESDYLKQVGFISGQKQSLNQFLPGRDAILLNALQYDMRRNEAVSKIEHLAKKFNIAHKLDSIVRSMSLGERMKCEIIASIIHGPAILFLDEPTLGLDFESRNTLCGMIREINQLDRITTVLTSHHLNDITELCQHVVIINQGIKLAEGPLQEIVSTEHKNDYTRSIIKELKKYT